MRVLSLIATTVVVLTGCTEAPFEGEPYGAALTLSEVTPVTRILDEPESFVGRRVLVQGTIAEVCDRAGCWMDILDADGTRAIQVKVDDGEIVFPTEATGRVARVEGVVEKLELSHEEALAAAEHRAEEQGEEFDPASVTGPETTYRIRGAGAVIAG